MYLGDTEVFRTSTAEPTADGIVWTYIKDMSQYNALWKDPQKLTVDLGNLINDVYTASYNVTLTAYFSQAPRGQNVRTADMILPISKQNSEFNLTSAFHLPAEHAISQHKVPSTASRAVVSISACGQSTEEFWWSNVFSSDTEDFNSTVGELYGYSPFREVQLYIDGTLAGVVWPFPIIFTGGIAPGFWLPIVGIDAFDLRQPEIDISPFLPLLTDGDGHSFEIKVVGVDISDDGTASLSDHVGAYWIVTGTIFLYLDDEASQSSGRSSRDFPKVTAPEPRFKTMGSLSTDEFGDNESLIYSIEVDRKLHVHSSRYSWKQDLSYSNYGHFNQQGVSQSNNLVTSGKSSVIQHGHGKSEEVKFEYPLLVNSTYGITDSGLTIDARMSRGLDIEATGVPGISTYTLTSGPLDLHTSQWGEAHYQSIKGQGSTSSGDTTDIFKSSTDGDSYHRSVRASNGTVVFDTEPGHETPLSAPQKVLESLGRDNLRSMLGRGPRAPPA